MPFLTKKKKKKKHKISHEFTIWQKFEMETKINISFRFICIFNFNFIISAIISFGFCLRCNFYRFWMYVKGFMFFPPTIFHWEKSRYFAQFCSTFYLAADMERDLWQEIYIVDTFEMCALCIDALEKKSLTAFKIQWRRSWVFITRFLFLFLSYAWDTWITINRVWQLVKGK